jgi:hypothetical protein
MNNTKVYSNYDALAHIGAQVRSLEYENNRRPH